MKRATTSASNISRRRDCPGSGRLEAGLAEEESEFSAEGVMLHKLFLTGERPPQLTPEQVETLNLADFYANEFFGNVRAAYMIPQEARFIDERECTLVFYDPKGKRLFPGHADVIRTWPDYDVRGVVDAKFGFMEVESAPDNLQLASYAAMRQQQSPAKAVGVCITQPRNFGPRFTQAVYEASVMPRTSAELERVILESEKPDAPLIAGEKQCHFCKAKTICEAYKAKFMAIEPAGTRALDTVPNDELERYHVAIAFATKIKDDVRDEMRKRIDAGTITGWKLQNSGDTVKLDNSLGLFNALKDYFAGNPEFTAKAFDDCREMQWGRLEILIQNLTAMSDKKVKEFIKEFSAAFVSRTAKEKRIVRDKGPKQLHG